MASPSGKITVQTPEILAQGELYTLKKILTSACYWALMQMECPIMRHQMAMPPELPIKSWVDLEPSSHSQVHLRVHKSNHLSPVAVCWKMSMSPKHEKD